VSEGRLFYRLAADLGIALREGENEL
jgi:hypothetical protein